MADLHPDDRKAWLEARRRSIGGSEVAAILGFSKWSSALQVYLDKSGLIESEESIRLIVGGLAEPMLAKLTLRELAGQDENQYGLATTPGDMIRRIRKASAHPEKLIFEVYGESHGEGTLIVRHQDFPASHATPDGVLFTGSAAWIWEAKTASEYTAGDWYDGTPDYYRAQCHHNAVICGLPGSLLSVLIGFGRFETEFMPLPAAPLENLGWIESWWKAHIIDGEEPEAVPMDLDTIKSLYPEGGGPRIEALHQLPKDQTERLIEVSRRYPDACEQEKEAKDLKAGIQARVRQIMGDADEVLLPSGATWTNKLTKKGHRQLRFKEGKK